MRTLVAALLGAALALPALAGGIASSVDPASVDARKATALGLYLTSTDAARALAADPSIVFLDVRSRAEFQFVGHPEPVDANVPYRFFQPVHDGKAQYAMKDNPDFLAGVAAIMAREGKGTADPVFVICRSGGRSARAAGALIAAGYTNVWNVIDGFEGARDKATGHRTVEGWRKAGLSWTYTVAPAQAYPPG